MRRLAAGFVVLLAFLLPPLALAQEGDDVSVSTPAVLLGGRFVIDIRVEAPAGATVDIDPLAESWQGVEVIAVEHGAVESQGGVDRHMLRVEAAAFAPGEVSVTPVVLITVDGRVTSRALPAFPLTVNELLPPGAALELIDPPRPQAVGGAQSPLLVPAIALGAVVALLALLAMLRYALAKWRARPRPLPESTPEPFAGVQLPSPEALAVDVVAGYRSLGQAIRTVLADRYNMPARALTATELVRRMQSAGVDRWEARLVSGLLDECNAVLYAGYRPARDRQLADIAMAEQIIGGDA